MSRYGKTVSIISCTIIFTLFILAGLASLITGKNINGIIEIGIILTGGILIVVNQIIFRHSKSYGSSTRYIWVNWLIVAVTMLTETMYQSSHGGISIEDLIILALFLIPPIFFGRLQLPNHQKNKKYSNFR
jgi:hypothetical protein